MNISIGIAQMNPKVGDIKSNLQKVVDYARRGNDIVICPELCLTGYPPMDLLTHGEFLEVQEEAIEQIRQRTKERKFSTVIIGAAVRSDDGILSNSALVISDGRINEYSKRLLPTYNVFDELRYFRAGDETMIFEISNHRIGISVCEDAWSNERQRYRKTPIKDYKDKDIDLLVNISASPFYVDKHKKRVNRFQLHSECIDTPIVFINQVGGNDELLFDGNSFVVNSDGIIVELPSFSEAYQEIDSLDISDNNCSYPSRATQIQTAVEKGVSDYFRKTGFSEAILGMSGGIDSSVMATVAASALGSDNVYGVSLPSEVTSEESIRYARNVAQKLNIEFDVIDITDIVSDADYTLQMTQNEYSGTAKENVRARVRGLILMGISNTRNALVLTPDNKSESAIGYCTLYGDTVGALAPLGDVYKKDVYALAEEYNSNANQKVIAKEIINRPPTAELKQNQTDSDDIPDYRTVDSVLEDYLENNMRISEENEESHSIIQMLHNSEFKRHQTPPVLKVTSNAFDRGWKYPIAAEYSSIL